MAACLAILAFAGQQSPLQGGDEGRYTAVALELLRTRDPLHLQISEGIPHFTKPPLVHGAIALAVRACGRREWAARLPNGLAFFGACLLLWGIGRILLPARPWLCALVYATSVLPFGAASVITADTVMVFWQTAAVAAFLSARFGRLAAPGRQALLVLMWACWGVAFLAKGPPALVPLPALILADLAAGDRRGACRLLFSPGILLFAAIGCSWYLAAARANPGLLQYWLRQEVADRVTGGRALHHAQPIAILTLYVPALAGGFLPWTGVLLARARPWRRWMGWSALRGLWSRCPMERFLILWFAVPALVFCAFPNRQPLYLLPALAPLAILTARRLRAAFPGRITVALLCLWCCVLLAGRTAARHVVQAPDYRQTAESFRSVDPTSTRIAFVGFNTPWYGLRWYLDRQLDLLAYQPGDIVSRFRGPQHTLAERIAEGAADACFVVKREERGRFEDIVRAGGYAPSCRGEVSGCLLMRLERAADSGG